MQLLEPLSGYEFVPRDGEMGVPLIDKFLQAIKGRSSPLPPPPPHLRDLPVMDLVRAEPLVTPIALAAMFGESARPHALEPRGQRVSIDTTVNGTYLEIARSAEMREPAARFPHLNLRGSHIWSDKSDFTDHDTGQKQRHHWPESLAASGIHPSAEPANPDHLWTSLILEHVSIERALANETKELLEQLRPVENIQGDEARQLERIVELLIGRTEVLRTRALFADELEEAVVISAVEHLRVRVLVAGEEQGGYAMPVVYSLAIDLLDKLSKIEMRNEPEQVERLGAELLAVAVERQRDDLDVPAKIAEVLARATNGQISERDVLIAIAGPGAITLTTLLNVADVGVVSTLASAASSVGMILLSVVFLAWCRRRS